MSPELQFQELGRFSEIAAAPRHDAIRLAGDDDEEWDDDEFDDEDEDEDEDFDEDDEDYDEDDDYDDYDDYDDEEDAGGRRKQKDDDEDY